MSKNLNKIYEWKAFPLLSDYGPEISVTWDFIILPFATFCIFGDAWWNQTENSKLILLATESLQKLWTSHRFNNILWINLE